MSERITIRQAGGAPQERRWTDDSVAAPSSPPITVTEADLKREKELRDEDARWNHAIGDGINSRDRFMQRWISKHMDE